MRDNTQHLYNNFELRKLLIPIIVEQLLSSLMGTADTMMVSNVGSAAISAVSLVDSINILVIQALSALSAGVQSCAPNISAAKTKKMPTALQGRFYLSWSSCPWLFLRSV